MSCEEIQKDQSLAADLKGVINEVKDKKVLQRYYEENPYVVLAAAAALGYVAGGGLFSPFSRRLIRIGMRAFFIPVALTKVGDIASGK